MARIPIKLRAHREAIAALEGAGYTVTPVRFSRDDHLIVEVRAGDRRAQLTLAGSPRGPFFAAMLAQARHRLRAAPPEPVSGEC